MKKYSSCTNGFTLVEMSIVLVVIGLIVGAIFVGKDLINLGARHAQLSQHQKLIAAVNAFKLKFNCLPGDCSNATTFFGATDPNGNPVKNGNGDGRISAGIPSAGTNVVWGVWGTIESSFFWEHLILSGLWEGPYYDGTS